MSDEEEEVFVGRGQGKVQLLYAVEGGMCDYLCAEAEVEAAEKVCWMWRLLGAGFEQRCA